MAHIYNYFSQPDTPDGTPKATSSARRATRSSARLYETQPTQPLTQVPHGLPNDPSSSSSVEVIDLAGSETLSPDPTTRQQPVLIPDEDLGLDIGLDSSSAGTSPELGDSDKENDEVVYHSDGSKKVKTADGWLRVPAKFNNQPDERFFFDNRWFRRTPQNFRSNRRKAKSAAVWAYGSSVYNEATHEEHWICHCCLPRKRKIFKPAGTTSIRKHLRKHGVYFKGDQQPGSTAVERPSTDQGIIDRLFSIGGVFKEKLLLFFLMCNLAFFQIENVYFRDFLACMNLQLFNFVPTAANTIRGWVIEEYKVRKEKLKLDLAEARSKVSISFDLWTSPNCRALMAVIAHFIDKDGNRKHVLLALKPLKGAHSSENIAAALKAVIIEFRLHRIGRFGWIISDNAVVNDKACDLLLRDLFPQSTRRWRRTRRVRCFGHVVNIAAQHFLHGMRVGDHLREMDEAREAGNSDAVAAVWRKIGAMGMLHNLIRYIRLTPQRREEFVKVVCGGEHEKCNGLQLIPATQTRWNSAYVAITRALNLWPRLNVFQSTHRPDPRSRVRFEALNQSHWDTLEAIHDALEQFYNVTLDTEGRVDDLSSFIQDIDYLHMCISSSEEHWRDLYEQTGSPEHQVLQEAAHNAWLSIEKYYNLCDESPAYYAAMVLDPSLKFQWINENWGEHPEKQNWIEKVVQDVKKLWTDEYKGLFTAETTSGSDSSSDEAYTTTTKKRKAGHDRRFEELYEYKRVKTGYSGHMDAFDTFTNSTVEADRTDSLKYWNVRWESGCNRDLCQMALDLLAIPSMSAECERIFSATKLLITDRRNRLSDDIVEACECLRVWMKPAEAKPEDFDADNERSDLMQDTEHIDDIAGFGEEEDGVLMDDE